MDRPISSIQLAADLGTTLPRIHRAVRRGLIHPLDRQSRPLRFGPDAAPTLRARWGWVPPLPDEDQGCHATRQELTREEMHSLAALSRHPLGLRSARAVARAAGISPTTAARILPSLERRGLVAHRAAPLAHGRVGDRTIWTILWTSRSWQRIAGRVGHTVLPTRAVLAPADRVPQRLWHLFWDTDPRRLRLDVNGPYIADRLLRMNDLVGLGWMARTMDARSLREGALRRGLSQPQRRLAELLAASR